MLLTAATRAAHDKDSCTIPEETKPKRRECSSADIVATPCWRQRGTLRSSALRILMQSRALLPAPVANTRHSQCEAGGTRRAQTAWAAGRHGSARLQLRRSAQACRPTSRAARASRGRLPRCRRHVCPFEAPGRNLAGRQTDRRSVCTISGLLALLTKVVESMLVTDCNDIT